MPLQKCCGQITVFVVLHYCSSQSDEKQSVGVLSNDVTDDSSSGQDQPLEPKDETKPNNSVTTDSTSLINPHDFNLTHTSSLISSKSLSVNHNDQMKQTNLNQITVNEADKPKEEHCEDTSIEVKKEVIAQPENTEIQASILALETLLQVNPGMQIREPMLSKPQPTNNKSSERIASRNNKWEIDEKRGAQATLGPVLYANICLNLKEKHPGI